LWPGIVQQGGIQTTVLIELFERQASPIRPWRLASKNESLSEILSLLKHFEQNDGKEVIAAAVKKWLI